MAYDKSAKCRAQAKQDEAILVVGMIRVVNEEGVIIKEDGLGLLERDAVFALVGPALEYVPFESETPRLQCSYIVSKRKPGYSAGHRTSGNREERRSSAC